MYHTEAGGWSYPSCSIFGKTPKSNRLLKRPAECLPHWIMTRDLVTINFTYYSCVPVTCSLFHPFLYLLILFFSVQPNWENRASTQVWFWMGPGWDPITSWALLSLSTVKQDMFCRYEQKNGRPVGGTSLICCNEILCLFGWVVVKFYDCLLDWFNRMGSW